MCKVDIYPRDDGRPGAIKRSRRCDAYKNKQPCNEEIYEHTTPMPIPIPRANTSHHNNHYMPPSPRLTPGSSPHAGFSPRSPRFEASPRTSYYESDSDASRRRQQPDIHINDQPIRRHRRYETRGSRGERIVIVEGPPTPRTPPQQHGIPRTAPSSPAPINEALRHRPVIVDDRDRATPAPQRRVRIEVPPSPTATTTSEGSSSERRRQRREEERRVRDEERRREERRREREGDEEARRRRQVEARVARANAKISARPEMPVPRRSGTAYVRPTVEVPTLEVEQGVDDEEEEEEAQKQRLRERLMPRRRATIGAGSRRVRVELGDGIYRLE